MTGNHWVFRKPRAVAALLILLSRSVEGGLVFLVRRVRGPLMIVERAKWLQRTLPEAAFLRGL